MTFYNLYELRKDGETFYVGVTKNTHKRLCDHRRRFGQEITLIIIFAYEDLSDAYMAEFDLIKSYKSKGILLENKSSGITSENPKMSGGRKSKDPNDVYVPVTTYVKKRHKSKAKTIIDNAVKSLK